MKKLFYLLQSLGDASDADIFNVRVGAGRREQECHCALMARSMVDPSVYYHVADEVSRNFILNLVRQNPNRGFYVVSPAQMLKALEIRAYAATFENLGPLFARRLMQTFICTHKNISLCDQKNLQEFSR